MLRIEVQTVPHRCQPYNTVGYWCGCDEIRYLMISDLRNPDYEFLLFVHEVIEQALCIKRGISGDVVTKFDKEFTGDGEPGDDTAAPYHKEHVYATAVEYSLCKELGLDPKKYDEFLDNYVKENLP